MTLYEALEKLGIEDYADKIVSSNSTGELFHTLDYFFLAKTLKKDAGWFRTWFENIVEQANEKWERPESVYQHIIKLLDNNIKTDPVIARAFEMSTKGASNG